MDVDLAELIDNETVELNFMFAELFCVPDDVFDLHASPAMHKVLATREGYKGASEIAGANESLEALCSSAPHVPRDCMEALLTAYGMLATVVCSLEEGSDTPGNSPQVVVLALLGIAALKGFAAGGMGQSFTDGAVAERMRSEFLAKAGARGAQIRTQKYEPIKTWAMQMAATMKADDKRIARILARQLPAHLQDVSDDPERLIYDALRASRKLQ